MDEQNPYSTPSTPSTPFADGGSEVQGDSPLENTRLYLQQTRPWVIFMGALGALLAVLMLGIGFVVTGVSLVNGGGVEAAFSLIYFAMGGFYLAPSILLLRYARRISDFVNGGHIPQLNDALAAQRSFWRFIGVATAVMMVLYFGAIFLMVFGFAFISAV